MTNRRVADMHPAPETYDELWQKTRDYGAAVRAADPSAKILGFSEWGWPNYFCSAADHIDSGCFASSPDRKKHGGTPLVEWLLRKLRSYQQAHGARLVDYLDLHYYAQGGDNTDVTRSLWDPTYTDPSWIDSKIQLLPRMKQWVARDYPGTKTSLSEYNLSVADATTNALIEADTLGIFAREGLDLATFWPMPNDGSLLDDAFRMYRDYNGHGAKFGNTWVRSTSANQAKVAVYGARRSSDGAYTILVINKTDTELESKLSLSGISPSGKAQVWRWTGGSIDRILVFLMDALYAFPSLLLAIVFSFLLTDVLGGGVVAVALSLTTIYVPQYYRVVRSTTVSTRETTYVEAARAIGAKPITIMRKYVFGNVIQSVPVIGTLNAADALSTLAALGFLGWGIQPNEASEWGYDLSRALDDAQAGVWWPALWPGLAIITLITALTLVGEGLNETVNPALRRRRLQGVTFGSMPTEAEREAAVR